MSEEKNWARASELLHLQVQLVLKSSMKIVLSRKVNVILRFVSEPENQLEKQISTDCNEITTSKIFNCTGKY